MKRSRNQWKLFCWAACLAASACLIAVLYGTLTPFEPIHAQTLPPFENSPIGFASVNAMGQNGTTGGVYWHPYRGSASAPSPQQR